MRPATAVRLSEQERCTLERWVRSGTTEQRLVLRARMILAAAEGKMTKEIAQCVGVPSSRVSKWRVKFAREGVEGLKDAPRAGAPPKYGEETERRVLAVLDGSPPEGYQTWTGSLVAAELGDVSAHQVWRILRRHGIHLQRRRSWCVSTDPEFAAKAADIVGLYLDPPDNAVVLCVDEKPHIQALERAQGWLRLPNGKALTGRSHDYTRHGTTTLFAALDIVSGQVKTAHTKRRRRREFLTFMNELVALYPDKQVHVILDNLNTHKPKHDRWLSRHKRVQLHYTPTHASWLNEIEIWFSILSRQALKGASFTSARELRERIDQFVQAYNEQATPFEWKKTVVHQKHLKQYYSDLCN